MDCETRSAPVRAQKSKHRVLRAACIAAVATAVVVILLLLVQLAVEGALSGSRAEVIDVGR